LITEGVSFIEINGRVLFLEDIEINLKDIINVEVI